MRAATLGPTAAPIAMNHLTNPWMVRLSPRCWQVVLPESELVSSLAATLEQTAPTTQIAAD